MAHVLVVIARVLAMCAFCAGLGLVGWFCIPRFAGRTAGSSIVYMGGILTRRISGSHGTVLLELREDGIVLRGRGPFKLFIARWSADYGELREPRAIRAGGKRGILFRAPTGPIAFWTPRWAEILDLLELRAVPVSRAVTKVRMAAFRRDPAA